MTFLTPAFFLGALALAVPVIIHLTNREKKEVVEFPSLMFLRRIPFRSVRRQKLRHLFLFALRCLALLLLTIAFARPFFESPSSATAATLGPREVVLVIDHSYSMGYENRLEAAKQVARSHIDALGPDDRGSLVLFSNRAEILNQPSSDGDELKAILDGIELSASTTRYGPALKLAKRIVDESNLPRKEVVLLSDFQRLGWEGDEDVWLPAGTDFHYENVGSDATDNAAVTGVILEREPTSGRERLTASARVTYKAPQKSPPLETSISIELNSRRLQTEPLELEPNSSTTVSFAPFTLPAGIARGTVRLEDDKLNKDNAYHFVLWPGQSLSVLSLQGRSRRSLYVSRALAIGDRPSFRMDAKRSNQFGAADLNGRQVVILNDVPAVSPKAARLLEEFVSRGGGLVVVLGEASGRNSFTGAAARLLPSPPGASRDRSRDFGGTLSYLDYGSPVFEIFSAPHSGDFTAAKFFRYRLFESPVTSGVLARFDDGAVALAEKHIGEGRVLVLTSTLDTFWNDLARQPVFLPFMHQMMKYAAGYTEAAAWHTVGDVADLDAYIEMMSDERERAGERDYDLVVSAPSGERTIVPIFEERALLPLAEQGFYELRRAGRGSGALSVMSLAANVDSAESDLSSLDPEELVAAVALREMASGESSDSGQTPAEQEARQGFWWYLLIGAFLLLVAETILSNRLSRARTVIPGAVGAA